MSLVQFYSRRPELLLQCPHMPRPHVHGIPKKVGPSDGIFDQKFTEPQAPLASITCSASRNQVAARLITLPSPRLDMVDRQLIWSKDVPAIDTPPVIAGEEGSTIHEQLDARR